MRQLKILTLLLMMMSAFVITPAQDSFDKYCAKIQILQDRKIQNEVGITAAQREKMNALAAKHQQRLEAYHKSIGNKQPDLKKLQGYMDQLNGQVLTLLSKQQIIRLRQLNLQAAGLAGVADPVVAKKLGIDSAHLKKFQTTLRAGQQAIASQMQGVMKPIEVKYQHKFEPYKGKEKEHQSELVALNKAFQGEIQAAQARIKPKIEALSKQTEAKLLAILTPAQKSAWTALKGKIYVPK